jgi:hypothetical protein
MFQGPTILLVIILHGLLLEVLNASKAKTFSKIDLN